MTTPTRLMVAAALVLMAVASLALAANPAADPNKVLRTAFPAAETGFDPAQYNDMYSTTVMEALFEPMLTYDYLARPVKLAPRTLDALPEVAEGGKVFTFRIKQGIRFIDDPAFKGKPRELTAQDYAYSIMRLADPKLRSPFRYNVEDKIKGMTARIKAAEKSGRFNYDEPVAGLEVLDRYTLRITLEGPDFNYPYVLAMPTFGAVAREVVEHYGPRDIGAHPVGTGPYKLAKWARSSLITLVANPDYRGHVWNYKAHEAGDEQLVKEMQGKMLPTIGRIEIAIMEEDQARMLAFQGGELDLFQLEGTLAPRMMNGNRLNAELEKKGAKLSRIIDPEIQNPYLSMRDPLTGGLSKEKIALRRAILMAYDDDEEIAVVHRGQAERIEFPVPPGVVGHLPGYRSSNPTNVPLANALLDKFGYRVGSDGFRTLPDGKPLSIRYSSYPDSHGRQKEEMWAKTFKAIKIRMETDRKKFPEILKAEKSCQLQMRTNRWIADYPDGENFMQLFYSKNIGQSNNSCTDIPEFDALYEKARLLPAGPERDALYVDMARLLEYYGAHRVSMARAHNRVMQKHVIGYKKHPILLADWLYADIDLEKTQ
jgi:oligopeptide transport system substrate-binding protein